MLGEDGAGAGRSDIQSSVNSSIPFFIAPKTGTALRAVSARPRITPLRRIVSARNPTATSAPTNGRDFPRRRASRRPAQRPTLRPLVMESV